MARRELPALASRIARVISGAQCSTSAATHSLNSFGNVITPNCAATGLNARLSSTSSSIVVDLRHSSSSLSRSFATEATAPTSDGLTISEAAAARLEQLQKASGERPLYLRLTVEGGGCSGFQYEFSLEEERPSKGDQTFTAGNAIVVCDDVSMEFLKGATVDFESDLMRSAFVVQHNPNAQSSCGCGSSFAAK